MWKGAVVLISVLAVTMAYQALSPLQPKPDKFKDQPGCYIPSLDKVIPLGESFSPVSRNDKEPCEKYSCSTDMYQITGCGSVATQPPCKIQVNRNKAYPDCCRTIVCPAGNLLQ